MDDQHANTGSESASKRKRSIPYGSRDRTNGYRPTGKNSGTGSGASQKTSYATSASNQFNHARDQRWNVGSPQPTYGQQFLGSAQPGGDGWTIPNVTTKTGNRNNYLVVKILLAIVTLIGFFTIYIVINAFLYDPLAFLFGDTISSSEVLHVEGGAGDEEDVTGALSENPESIASAPAPSEGAATPLPSAPEAPVPAPTEQPTLKQPISMPPHHGGEIYGSGCVPGQTDVVPTGVWYGYMRSIQGNTLFFDMVCYRGPGSETNDASTLRRITIDGFEPPNSNRIGVEVSNGVLVNYWYAP